MTTEARSTYRKTRAHRNGFGVKAVSAYDDGARATETYQVTITRATTCYPQYDATSGRWACECANAMAGYECTHIQRARAYRETYE